MATIDYAGMRPHPRLKKRELILRIVKYAALGVILLFLLFPFVFMVNKSMFEAGELGGSVVRFFPSKLNFKNYAVFANYLPYLWNTLQIVLINGIFVPLSACICAYPLARRRFTGKKVVFGIIMATVMIPGIVLTIPTFTLYSKLGLYDRVASQWITAFFGGGALNIFLVIQFMRTIPREMDEAASIDGANAFVIFFALVMPLCMNIFLYIAINTFIGLWMDFQGPLIYLISQEKRTMALQFYNEYYNLSSLLDQQHEMSAMAVCMTIPPMILYLVFQKNMIGGIKIGGVKG